MKKTSNLSVFICRSSYERWNPSCNYGLSIYCHSPSLLIGQTIVPGATHWYGKRLSPYTTGRRQPARDYASNQCPAMLMNLGRVKWSSQSNGSGGRGGFGDGANQRWSKGHVLWWAKKGRNNLFKMEMNECLNQIEIIEHLWSTEKQEKGVNEEEKKEDRKQNVVKIDKQNP